MKPTDQDNELHTALRPWTDQAAKLVERRIQDTKQYALGGMIATGNVQLTELSGALNQTVGDARASFYRQAFQQHARAGLDPDVHQLGLGPDQEGELAARHTPILGRLHRDELLDVVADAQASLTSAALADENRTAGDPFLRSRADQNRDRLVSLTARQLSDAQIAIFQAVGQILVKPELR